MLIEELASRERQLDRWILRGTKVLSHSNWFTENYHVKFTDSEALLAYLRSVPVDLIVLDRTRPGLVLPHHLELMALVLDHPADFELVFRTNPDDRYKGDYCCVDVYRLKRLGSTTTIQVGVSGQEMIGRKLFQDWKLPEREP